MNDIWDSLAGQQIVKQTLQQFVDKSKVPHALLFQGNEGVGKTFCAIKFAGLLNINSPEQSKVSRSITTLSEPYIKYIFPLPRAKNETDESGPFEKFTGDEMETIKGELEEKIKNPYYKMEIPKAAGIKISSIRDIKKFLSFDFSEIAYRIVLIEDAHLMNEESQNALLKSLEEPPEGVIFILTTPFPDLLRETIRSRCWLVKFQPLTEPDVVNVLNKYFDAGMEEAEKIAPFSGGSVTSALQLIENDFDELLNKTILLLRYSLGKKYHSAISVYEPFLKEQNNYKLKLLINLVLVWLNDLAKYRFNPDDIYFKDHIETLEKFTNKFPAVQLNQIVVKVEKLLSLFKKNVNPSVICLNLVFELSGLTTPEAAKNR